MLADDEYVIDVEVKLAGLKITYFSIETNKGVYSMPLKQRSNPIFSIQPVNTGSSRNVLIGFAGQYTRKVTGNGFNLFKAYYVSLDVFTEEQRQNFFAADPSVGPQAKSL